MNVDGLEIEKLPLGFEVPQFKRLEDSQALCPGLRGGHFRWAHVKVVLSVRFVEERHSIHRMDFGFGEDAEAV